MTAVQQSDEVTRLTRYLYFEHVKALRPDWHRSQNFGLGLDFLSSAWSILRRLTSLEFVMCLCR